MIIMILEFMAKNCRSFREELVFSMAPKPIRDLSEELKANEALMFSRDEKVEFGSFKTIAVLLDDGFKKNEQVFIGAAN
jgi:hypothetical protein